MRAEKEAAMIDEVSKQDDDDREVPEKVERRRFTAEYKQEILRRADACTKHGELGALLRAEGLYSSHLATWRRLRDAGELDGLAPKKRGRKPKDINPLASRVTELERQNRRLQARVEKAEALVALQKKFRRFWG
jgi:transposase